AREEFPSTTTVKTFNSIGDSVWRKTCEVGAVNKRKMGEFLTEYIKEMKWGEDREAISLSYFEILEGIRFATNLAYVPNGKFHPVKSLITRETLYNVLEKKPTPLIGKVIDDLLVQSIKAAYAGHIDFDDQIYMPTLFGGTFPNYPRVLADEIQDVNPVNI